MTNRQHTLFKFVQQQHKGQIRKYTNKPYHTHLASVAYIVSQHTTPESLSIEIALCHDLLEDTKCTDTLLKQKLIEFGYTQEETLQILITVIELTDVYTKEAFPSLNRKARKQLEAHRLHSISPLGQTVKYADLLDNTESIVLHDKGFAEVYLKEKRFILSGMTDGDNELYQLIINQIK